MLTKLSELMFIDVLRRYIETLPPQKKLAGLPACAIHSVGKALALIHDKPAHDWTIEALAKQSGLSRVRCWPNVSPRSSGFRRCTISPNGGCRLLPNF